MQTNLLNTKVTLDQAIWLTLFAVLCIAILLQLDAMLEQVRKARVMVFHTMPDDPNVIEGDFKAVEFPSKAKREADRYMNENGAENEP